LKSASSVVHLLKRNVQHKNLNMVYTDKIHLICLPCRGPRGGQGSGRPRPRGQAPARVQGGVCAPRLAGSGERVWAAGGLRTGGSVVPCDLRRRSVWAAIQTGRSHVAKGTVGIRKSGRVGPPGWPACAGKWLGRERRGWPGVAEAGHVDDVLDQEAHDSGLRRMLRILDNSWGSCRESLLPSASAAATTRSMDTPGSGS
jgi:hypothetical protein